MNLRKLFAPREKKTFVIFHVPTVVANFASQSECKVISASKARHEVIIVGDCYRFAADENWGWPRSAWERSGSGVEIIQE